MVPHAVLVEALGMVDEAKAYVDPDTGLEEAVPATADWLAEWALKAVAAIATDSVRQDRLPDKDPGWRAEHEERLALLAKLAALGERRLPVVMTLLGWPDAEAVEAMAAAEQPPWLTLDRYRALAERGMRGLVEGLDPAWAGSVEGQLAGLRWRVQSVMHHWSGTRRARIWWSMRRTSPTSSATTPAREIPHRSMSARI